MTTTDTLGAGPSHRLLRRSRSGRVAAGVSVGLGEYFGVDPVLFRVLFATAAFFGGAGILAYLLAWAAVPEEGTPHAPLDGWVGWLRRRHVPVWAVAVAAVVLFWLVSFSWWAPVPFVPVIVVGLVVAVLLSRREYRAARPATAPEPAPPSAPVTPDSDTVSLTKDVPASTAANPVTPLATAARPRWVGDARSWFDDATAAARARRRRTAPIRVATLVTLIATWTVLGVVDAVRGLPIPVYPLTGLGIVGLGLLVGLALRRFPFSLLALLVPLAVVSIGLGGTHASLHDGVGQQDWTPVSTATPHYRLAFGQGTLDLTKTPVANLPSRIDVTVAAGRVHIVAPRTVNLTVVANVRFGAIAVDGLHEGGGGLHRVVYPPAGASGHAITVDVHLADGEVAVERT